MNGGISLASKMPLLIKIVHIKFQFLTHSLMEIISLWFGTRVLYTLGFSWLIWAHTACTLVVDILL